MNLVLRKGADFKAVKESLIGMGFFEHEIGEIKTEGGRSTFWLAKPHDRAIPLLMNIEGVEEITHAKEEVRATFCPAIDG